MSEALTSQMSLVGINETTAPLDVENDEKQNTESKKRANELDGKTWTRNSISIWSDIRKTAEEVSLKHPAMFPSALVTRLIESFTNNQDKNILDPFAGVGSTLIAARNLGKNGIGIERSQQFFEIARQRCEQKSLLDEDKGSAEIYHADALDLLNYVNEGSIDFVVTSPPYWDILNEKRSADYKEVRHYGNYNGDLGTISDYKDFLAQLQKIFVNVFKAMRAGAYCCVIVMDIRKKDKFYPFHSDIASMMQEIGFIFDDIIIWDRRHEYNNMRPLGYPSVFRINKAHEFILIFQKPKAKE